MTINRPPKVLVVFGTRPEAIKMAPLVHELNERTDLSCKVILTAQHREMLDQVLEIFSIRADYDLDLMKKNQSLHSLSSRIIDGMSSILESEKPDMVLVHGDTTTSFAVALACYYSNVSVGHVEAGLRTNNLRSPWPEEGNRQLTARLATLHFAPTNANEQNLLHEGIPKNQIYITGNTVIDSILWMNEKLENKLSFRNKIISKIVNSGLPEQVLVHKFILVTGHRRENFGQGFKDICEAITAVATRFNELHFIYPVHLNPNVKSVVEERLGNLSNVHLIEPQDYASFVFLLNRCFCVLTDSGGIQEEAPSLGKPVLLMRENTERPEAVMSGSVKLIGTDKEVMTNSIIELITNETLYSEMSKASNPYGNGKSAVKIADIVHEHLTLQRH